MNRCPWNPAVLVLALLNVLAASGAHAQTLDPLNLHLPSATGTSINVIAVQPDGKFLVGGSFTSLGTGCGETPCPAARSNIARLNPDGSLDLDFNPGTNSIVYDIAVLPDGKILVSGAFGTI